MSPGTSGYAAVIPPDCSETYPQWNSHNAMALRKTPKFIKLMIKLQELATLHLSSPTDVNRSTYVHKVTHVCLKNQGLKFIILSWCWRPSVPHSLSWELRAFGIFQAVLSTLQG